MLRAATLLAVVFSVQAAQKPAAPFVSPYALDEMKGKQAVVDTSMGTFVIALLPEAAPAHVAYFMKTARDGGYNGTTFHRVIKYGLIQGGDPLSKDPAKFAQYGTGGLGVLTREPNSEKHTAGAVSAVLLPGKPDSAGTQFFVCASDQATLDGNYDVFGRVIDGLDVVQQISAVDADAAGRPSARIMIRAVTIRDAPAPVIDPFVSASAADMAAYRAVLETTKGTIELQFLPDKAPETVRNFLELASHQVYDGILVHRVVPGFVIQTGALAFRDKPLTPVQQKLVHELHEEFTETPNVPGLVSMARADDPNSATTSFFICVGECHALDGKYTAFAQVVAGMDVVKQIESTPVDGETPKTPVVVTRVTVKKP